MPEPSAIGRPLPRFDGPQKVRGLTRYAGDLSEPGMLHARLVLSPHPHARIVRIGAEAARAVPGVVAVLAGRDLPLADPDPGSRNRSPLALERVLFAGHPVVAVVAESEAVAEDATRLVEVEYEELRAAVDPLEAMRPDAPRVRDHVEDEDAEELAMHGAEPGARRLDEPTAPNVASTVRYSRGDVAAGFRDAVLVVEHRYRTAMLHQGYLEPQAAVASPDGAGGVAVWASTQGLFYTRSEVAEALGLPEHRVRAVAMPVGGGFGGKFVLLEPLAAALALAVRRPVALVLSRSEEFLATTPAPQSILEIKTGVRRDGRLTALQAQVIFDAGAYPGAPVGVACSLLGGYYRFPSMRIDGYEVLTHKPGSGAYRAPGAPQATFAIESQMDEMARQLGLDPIEFRLINAVDEGNPMANGRPWPGIGLRACLETLKSRVSRLASAGPETRDQRLETEDAGLVHGVGVAVGGWTGGVEPASAACRLNGDGTLSVVVGSVDLSGTNMALAQIAAEAFGAPVERVEVVNAESDSAPYAGASSGSKVVYTVGAAVQRAAEDAREQVLSIACDVLEAAVDDLELVDQRVQVRGARDRSVPLATLAQMSMQFGGKHPPVFGRGQSATVARAPGFAAHLAEVAVEVETGRVRVVRQVVAQDVGRALNPAAIEGQIRGGVAQGVGWALLERMVYDSSGRLVTGTLMDYALPSADQAPNVEIALVEVAAAAGPFGAKGVGEPPVVAAGAAIANAVADATNHRFTEWPITPEQVARALMTDQKDHLRSGARASAQDTVTP